MSVFVSRARLFFSVAAAAAVSLTLGLTGCGESDPAGPGNRDSGLVTGAGEAWVDCEASYCDDGYVFLSNGTFRWISHSGGDNWYYGGGGQWSTRGSNELVLTGTEEESYTVSGDTFTLYEDGYDDFVYTKMTGLTVEIMGSGGGNSGGSRDSRLVTEASEAWVVCETWDVWGVWGGEEYCRGIMLRSNGDIVHIWQEGGDWYGYNDHTVSWSTRGNNTIILTFRETVKYVLSGEDLALTWTYYDWDDDVEEQYTDTYTKRTGLTITARGEYDDEYYKRRAGTAKRPNGRKSPMAEFLMRR
jgi:hypothetical protein